MAVEAVTGATTAWVSDVDPGACKILAHRYPDVPNLGDITEVDFRAVEPVDILTGGFPCQDVSHAGKRAGLSSTTRSGLWSHMARAIDELRPSLVVAENVRGLLSATADSDVEPCPWCMGDDEGSPLRALGVVLADLADLGYDAAWVGLPASGVGAPHGRFRVFILAWPTDAVRHPGHDAGHAQHGQQQDDATGGPRQPSGGAAANANGFRLDRPGDARHGWAGLANGGLLPTPRATRGGSSTETVGLLPTPRATDGTKGGPNQRGSSGDLMLPSAVALLPTPAVNDMGEGKTVEAWDEWTARMKAAHGNGNGHGASLAIEAQRLLPTPEAADGSGGRTSAEVGGTRPSGAKRSITLGTVTAPQHASQWGDYAAAIARWEHLTRPAPAPTMTSAKGTPQLSPRFSEWLMGLPVGWVTDVPGLTRAQQLKALGNGVVPAQAAAALAHLLALIPRPLAARSDEHEGAAMLDQAVDARCPLCSFPLSTIHDGEWWCSNCPYEGCHHHPTEPHAPCGPTKGTTHV